MKNGKTIIFFSSFIVIALLLVSGCRDQFKLPGSEELTTGTDSFSLIISTTNERTILPKSIQMDKFNMFILKFGANGTSTNFTVQREDCVEIDAYTLKVEQINLEDNKGYDLTVEAYIDGGILAAKGNVGIRSGGHDYIYTVSLQPLMSAGTGKFSWDIEFDFSAESGLSQNNLSKANMQIIPLNPAAGVPEQTFYFADVENETPQKDFCDFLDIAAGYYRVIFTLEISDLQPIIRREILHIYPDEESYFGYTFTEKDFNNITYTVTFLHNNGVSFMEIPVTHGKTVRETMIENGLDTATLLPRGITVPCNVIFDSDGGNVVSSQEADCTFTFNWHTYSLYPLLTLDAYDFDTPVSGDIALYAGWTPEITVNRPTDPVKNNDTFIGWYADFYNWRFDNDLDGGNWTFSSGSNLTVFPFSPDKAVGRTTFIKPADIINVSGSGVVIIRAIWNTPPTNTVTGVSLDRKSIGLREKETASLIALVQPDNAANKTVTWTTSNPNVAVVSGGTVMAVSLGKATITVTTAVGGYTDTCVVNVCETVNFENLSGNDIYLVKVNTSNLVVAADETGFVSGLSVASGDNGGRSYQSKTTAPDWYIALQELNANLPPFVEAPSRGTRAVFIPPVVGDTREFYTSSGFSDGGGKKWATLRATGEYGNIWVADNNYTFAEEGEGNKITTALAEALASKFDIIYPAVTNILGYEYGGGPGGDGGRDGDPKIQILVYDIGGGVAGYFTSADYSIASNGSSNMAEMFYLDSTTVNNHLDFMYSSMAHEFQHMINFNEKSVKRRVSSPTWYNEMLSMMTEDVIASLIGVNLDPGIWAHPICRIPEFLNTYDQVGITEWIYLGGSSYAKGYAFGAYLLRNYGGAELLKSILSNDTAGIPSITAALNEYEPGLDFEQALIRFGEAMIYSGQPADKLTFNKTVTSTIGDFIYTSTGFDIWEILHWDEENGNYYGPKIFDLTPKDMRFHSVTIHQLNEWKNITGDFSISLLWPDNPDVKFYFYVK